MDDLIFDGVDSFSEYWCVGVEESPLLGRVVFYKQAIIEASIGRVKGGEAIKASGHSK